MIQVFARMTVQLRTSLMSTGKASTESDESKSLVCTDDDPGKMCMCIQSMCCELPMTLCSSE